MNTTRFSILYCLCMLSCWFSVVQLKAQAEVPVRDPAPQEVDGFIALPVKPDGAGREGVGDAPLHSWEGCEVREGDFRDACFKALAWQRSERDVDGALLACGEVQERDQRQECIADVAELHSRTDRARAETICPQISKKKWRDQCWFGIALAWSIHDYEYARLGCEKAGMWRDFCRHDVNGEIAQVDSKEALAWCKREEGTALQRKTCFHGLGKYLGRTDPQAAVALCDRVPTHNPLYQENCVHGIGWAVAEKQSESDTAAFCRRLENHSDSCFLGLSAHTKRLSPERAEAHCSAVVREDLKKRCEAFARRVAFRD